MKTLGELKERELGGKLVKSLRWKPAKNIHQWTETRYMVDGSTFTAIGVFRRLRHVFETIETTGEYPE